MIKEMNLLDEYFKAVKSKKKTVEVRLYDVKRKNLKFNDIIRFNNRLTNEKIDCKVVKLIKYDNLEELLKNCDVSNSKEEILNIYSLDEINKYGLLAIYIEVV